MYDFSTQQKMLKVAYLLIKEKKLLDIAAFGGGTALSAFYWNHRFSTDIDIFLYGEVNYKEQLIESTWNESIRKTFSNIGYKKGNMINNSAYLEFKITSEEKIQFLDVLKRTDNPYVQGSIFGLDMQIETINEIIAKKVFFRAHKGNSRDIFDIAVALHKNPYIFQEINTPLEKLESFLDILSDIESNQTMYDDYKKEIIELNPTNEYKAIALMAVEYLLEYLNDYVYSMYILQPFTKEVSVELENEIYEDLLAKTFL